MPDGAAELVFQVLSERHERGSLIVTTNLPFGEWTKVFPDPRLAKAVVDRLTHRAHIIDTGNECWRFRHGLERQTKQRSLTPARKARTRRSPLRPRATRSASRRQARLASHTSQSGNINTNNNRRQVGPLQASAVGPAQTSTTTRVLLWRETPRVVFGAGAEPRTEAPRGGERRAVLRLGVQLVQQLEGADVARASLLGDRLV